MEQENGISSASQSPTFDRDVQIRVHETVGSASVSPCGRDVVLASREGLHIIDLDSPYSPPRHLAHSSPWEVADVQWSPFASHDHWIVSTSNQKALVWNLELPTAHAPIEHTLHAHSRAITDINFSAHHPNVLSTCAVDSYVHCWDLRRPAKPVMTFADWNAGATQVKWNRQDPHIIASAHDKYLHIWDDRKGAYPLKSIEAHTTKIYGLDWNRTRSTGILTCSLDKTIKFWDYGAEKDEPERVIRTLFPVWRARHTPFGWGVLAMPQRGNFDLHLFDRRLQKDTPVDGLVQPVHTFEGHRDQVKEFLWRWRGEIDHGIDNRDFQLLSWGVDRELHLHRIDARHLQAVGYEKGKDVRKRLVLTRQGATYKTYHTDTRDGTSGVSGSTRSIRPQGLGALVSAAGMSKAQMTMGGISPNLGFMNSSIRMYGRRTVKRSTNPIKWMEGVKMGRRRGDTLGPFLQSRPSVLTASTSWDTPESLSDEMTFVSRKYKKVDFEKADVHQRLATVTLHGPWGAEGKSAFIRVTFEFPDDYPTVAAPTFFFERTTSGVSEDILKKLAAEVKVITEHYMARKVGCLEAVITYLLGERKLEESIEPPEDAQLDDPLDAEEESSSDEEGLGPAQDLENSATENLGLNSAQANVPLPKACGAFFAPDGRLVCFFPPKPEPKPLFSLDALRNAERMGRNHRHFEGFGRLVEESPHGRARSPASSDDEAARSSPGSWTSSSSSSTSSEDSNEIIHLPARFKPPSAWRAATLRWQKSSSHSSGGRGQIPAAAKPKSVISIHDMSEFIPSKRVLAAEYQIYGDGPTLCAHNAAVARRHGEEDAAAVWDLCSNILYDGVPLEILDQQYRKEPILVLARRNVVRIRRKEVGLDWMWDEPPAVSNPRLTGRVKWGRHPLATSWLIPALFEYFEKAADIQMLAMLSCLFYEPAAREGVSNALMKSKQVDLPIAMKAPAFSLDYFPSKDVAWSLYQEAKRGNGSSTPLIPHGRRPLGYWDYFNNGIGTYGSTGSSNGPWAGDVVPSEPLTPYSTGNTPPNHPRLAQQGFTANLSTSPDASHRAARRSASNLSTAFASLSRPFSNTTSSSPDDRHRVEPDLSTSAPSGITWGTNTIFSGSSTPSPEKRRRSLLKRHPSATIDSAYNSEGSEDHSESEDEPSTPLRPLNSVEASPTVQLRLKNQHLFDDEAFASAPLLDIDQAEKYAAYRELYADQLGVWGLAIARAEVLKFNGLTSYWASDQYENEQAGLLPQLTLRRQPRAGQSLLTMATAPDQVSLIDDQLNSPRVTVERPAGESSDSSTPSVFESRLDIKRAHKLNPAAKPFTPSINPSSALPPEPSPFANQHVPAHYKVYGDGHPHYAFHASHTAPAAQLAQEHGISPHQQICVFCWQPTGGLFFYACSTHIHVAHASCLAMIGPSVGRNAVAHPVLICDCPGLPTYRIVSSPAFGGKVTDPRPAVEPQTTAPQALPETQAAPCNPAMRGFEYAVGPRRHRRLERHPSSAH